MGDHGKQRCVRIRSYFTKNFHTATPVVEVRK